MIARLAPPGSRRLIYFALVALGVYVSEGVVVASGAFVRRPELIGGAVVFDLIIAVPFAWWLLVVRRGSATTRTLIPVILASIFGARILLPPSAQGMVPWMRWLLAPFELAVIAWVVMQVRAIVRERRVSRVRSGGMPDAGYDLMADLHAVLAPAFGRGRLAQIVGVETGLLYYALLSWGRPPHVPAAAQAIAAERNGGLILGVIMAVAGETVPLHLFVSGRWGALPAWLLTASSIYAVLWLVGDFRAIALRPSFLTPDALTIRIGLRADAVIRRSSIARVERVTWRTIPPKAPDYFDTSSPGEPNLVLHLTSPVEVRMLFGMRRLVSRIGMRVEQPDGLVRELALAD